MRKGIKTDFPFKQSAFPNGKGGYPMLYSVIWNPIEREERQYMHRLDIVDENKNQVTIAWADERESVTNIKFSEMLELMAKELRKK